MIEQARDVRVRQRRQDAPLLQETQRLRAAIPALAQALDRRALGGVIAAPGGKYRAGRAGADHPLQLPVAQSFAAGLFDPAGFVRLELQHHAHAFVHHVRSVVQRQHALQLRAHGQVAAAFGIKEGRARVHRHVCHLLEQLRQSTPALLLGFGGHPVSPFGVARGRHGAVLAEPAEARPRMARRYPTERMFQACSMSSRNARARRQSRCAVRSDTPRYSAISANSMPA